MCDSILTFIDTMIRKTLLIYSCSYINGTRTSGNFDSYKSKKTEKECTSFGNLCDAVKRFGMIVSTCGDKLLAK